MKRPTGPFTTIINFFTKVTETRVDYNYYSDLNKGAGGRYIYLRYQY